MRMLRKNTRAPPPRRLRDRLHAIDARESWLFSLSSRHISRTQSFQEKRPIKIKDLATLKRFVAVIGRSVPCTARLASRRTDRQTDRQTKYRDPRCACAPRVNNNEGSNGTPNVMTPSLLISLLAAIKMLKVPDCATWRKNRMHSIA